MSKSGKTAVVTGANAGLGFSVCKQLLAIYNDLNLCLACRNDQRAQDCKEILLKLYPKAHIDITLIDVSSIESVLKAVSDLKKKYVHIDLLYLNAGVMHSNGLRWSRIFSCLFSKNVVHILATGEGLIIQEDRRTKDGLMQVFATNLFGHYVLFRELEPVLGNINKKGGCSTSQLVWSSSSNASPQKFDLNDIQHEKGDDAYSSSKYATDLLSVALNHQYNKQGIYSHTTCPGFVKTSLTDSLMPWGLWLFVLPLLFLMRLFVHSLSLTPEKGATALVWLSHQHPETLDPLTKFLSLCTITGHQYVGTEKMKLDVDQSIHFLEKMETLRLEQLKRLREKCVESQS